MQSPRVWFLQQNQPLATKILKRRRYLETTLELSSFPEPGERISIRKTDAKGYSFEEYPESLDDDTAERMDVEVLRAGWKVKGKVVVNPTVCEIAEDRTSMEGVGVAAGRERFLAY